MVALGVIYAGLMVALPPGAFFSGDEGIKWLQIDALWRHRWTTLDIDPPSAVFDPSAEFIPPFLVRHGSSLRSVFPSVLPLLASVPYALGGSRGIYLVPALAALACIAASFRLGRYVTGPGWAALAAAASVAASPLAFYGATIWEHTLAAALCTAAMIPLARGEETGGRARQALLGTAAGLTLGAAAAARTECLLLIPAVVLAGAVAYGMRAFSARAAGLLAGAVAVLAPLALYHRMELGSWLPPHLAANLPGGALGRTARAPWTVAADLLGPAGWDPRLTGAAVMAGALVWLLGRSRRARAATAPSSGAWTAAGLALAAGLTIVGPLRTLALELSPVAMSTHQRGYQSLLHTMPILSLIPLALLAPPAPARPHARFLGWTAGLFLALASASAPVEGGLQWGPRLLLPVAPLVTLALASAMVSRREAGVPGGRPAVAALVVALGLGLVMQGAGLRFLVTVRTYNAGVIERVRGAVPPGGVILSDFFAVPQILATLWRATPVLYVAPGSDLEGLSARLDAAGVTPFWILRERPKGLDAIDLGAGLTLVRYGKEDGARGFLTSPRGD